MRAQRNRSPEQHSLRKLVWPQVEQSPLEGDLLAPQFPLEKEAAWNKAEAEVVELLRDALGMLEYVLSIPKQTIELTDMPPESPAAFYLDEQGEPHVLLSAKMGGEIVGCISAIYTKFVDPATVIESKRVQDLVGRQIAWCIDCIAHELYHARQAHQDAQYYIETLRENLFINIAQHFSGKEAETLTALGKKYYEHSAGEKAARAFAVRFILEFRKIVAAKADRSTADRLFLLGAESFIEEELKFIAKFARPNTSDQI